MIGDYDEKNGNKSKCLAQDSYCLYSITLIRLCGVCADPTKLRRYTKVVSYIAFIFYDTPPSCWGPHGPWRNQISKETTINDRGGGNREKKFWGALLEEIFFFNLERLSPGKNKSNFPPGPPPSKIFCKSGWELITQNDWLHQQQFAQELVQEFVCKVSLTIRMWGVLMWNLMVHQSLL